MNQTPPWLTPPWQRSNPAQHHTVTEADTEPLAPDPEPAVQPVRDFEGTQPEALAEPIPDIVYEMPKVEGDFPEGFVPYVDPYAYAPGEVIPIPKFVLDAIKSAPMHKIVFRNWRLLPQGELTVAEAAMYLLENMVRVPSGRLVGQPLRFMLFQEVMLYLLLDTKPEVFILSMARRNGKTFILSCLVLLYLVSKLASYNSEIASAATSREQAALVYKEIENMLLLSEKMRKFVRTVPSAKRLVGLVRNVNYKALSAEAKTGFGQSLKVVVLDEAGQILGPDNDYVGMLRTSQGSVEDPLFAIISTQAASDGDYLSVMIDTAIRDDPEKTVCIVFETPKDLDIMDEAGWFMSNPGLGVFRSLSDMKKLAESAKAVPQSEGRFRNLNLNQRISLTNLWVPPAVWRSNDRPVDIEVFKRANKIAVGIDLSKRIDLTAAVFAAEDEDGYVHLIPHVFTPQLGIEQRELRDKAPYQHWVREKQLIAVPGSIIEYGWVAEYLQLWCNRHGIEPTDIAYDRWRIDMFQADCENKGAFTYAEWHPVGQGYRDMSPRVEYFEALYMGQHLAHGNHPLLNLAAGHAVATADPAGNRKLDKSKSFQRIDPIVAAVMAAYQLNRGREVDIDAWIV